ncbi:MAG: sigma-70 family RNA polymerase sigma factor [Candidatus Eisenbacteria bacterium]
MSTSDVTTILRRVRHGESPAEDLFPIVYDELRQLASRHLRGERSAHTLQTTALVHEAYVRLVDLRRIEWQDRAHFFGVASGAIRRILIDHARARSRAKRGGGMRNLSLDDIRALGAPEPPGPALLELDRALEELQARHPEKARVVELRFFGGLTLPEIAEVMGITRRTADRYWSFARTWLYRELKMQVGIGDDLAGAAE